jgi:drug/metabolite transporter (DMT)-like permease
MKITLWLGVLLLLAGVVLFFLAGSTSNGSPTVAAIYGTNQGYWGLLALVGLILLIVGIVGSLMRRK